jgi:NADP-dependent 3-hydroxy acid dehydrogenase YdfG
MTINRWSSLDILINNVGTNIRKKAIEYSAEDDTCCRHLPLSVG